MADDDVQVTDCAATNSPKYPLPFQAPHSFLKGSELVNSSGFVDVNPSTLQHSKHTNVFALGGVLWPELTSLGVHHNSFGLALTQRSQGPMTLYAVQIAAVYPQARQPQL